jgi:hypothetical protein
MPGDDRRLDPSSAGGLRLQISVVRPRSLTLRARTSGELGIAARRRRVRLLSNERSARVLVGLAVAVATGGVGRAWVFNPASGAVTHSLVLWRICYVTLVAGFAILMVLAIVTAIVDIRRDWGSPSA